ncbi:MAG: Fructokinase [bacterium]|nr:Fructokinase [bacterium]
MVSIGIDVGGTKIEILAIDEMGMARFNLRVPTPDSYQSTLSVIRDLVNNTEQYLGEFGSVGIATPGVVVRSTGRMRNARLTPIEGEAFATDVQSLLARPIRIANDGNCFVLAEALSGAACEAEVVFGAVVGTGVGGGIAIRGQLITGENGIAGEWGHNLLPQPSDCDKPLPLCQCGRYGCIQTYLSGPGLADDHRTSTGIAMAPEEIVAGMRSGDKACHATFSRYVDRMARSLAQIINTLDPNVIVLGGGLSSINELYELVPQKWLPYVFAEDVGTQFLPPKYENSSVARGAACLWRNAVIA